MLRSMFTSISSLNLHQSYLDVVANNLANANTTGFKSSRVHFQDQFSQLLSPGASPSTNVGGTNPMQIGLGVQLGSISPLFTQGTLQSTGRNFDMAVQGDGFFIYGQNVDRCYSRDGALNLDSKGALVNMSTGSKVQGWAVDATGKVDNTQPISDITIETDRTVARATKNAILGGNISTSAVAATPIPVTMGVYDSLGKLHNVTITFTRSGDNTFAWDIAGDPATFLGSGTVTFSNSGQYVSNTVTAPVSVPGSTGAAAIGLTLDMSKLTMLTGDTSVAVTSQDGLPTGSVSDVYVMPDTGSIFLVYSNGMREQVAQLALARFSNPNGLIQSGSTSFKQGLNSGEPEIGTANSGGRGAIASQYLEASNVDMAQEFTHMILAQRGFQASSRVITTSDEILQELVNLKR